MKNVENVAKFHLRPWLKDAYGFHCCLLQKACKYMYSPALGEKFLYWISPNVIKQDEKWGGENNLRL